MKKCKTKIVTGYVPIPGHPRSAEEYGALGDKLFRDPTCPIQAPVKAYYTQINACWLYRDIYARDFRVKHYEGDNPEKNTIEYHIVNHQKAEWLYADALMDTTDADTFIWMDYGIAHQPGVTPQVVNEFLAKVAKDDFAIPGAWEDTSQPIEMSYPNWRFLGSLMIVPRQHIAVFDNEMKMSARRIIKNTHYISWEVNTLARVERLKRLPIRWYKGDHNETQFTGYHPYGVDPDAVGSE